MKSLFVVILGLIMAAGCYAANKPNIVMFYIDDWAWNGSPVPMDDSTENSCMPVLQMPNVEKLATQGMKFPNAYGSPQCSPARVCADGTVESTQRFHSVSRLKRALL
jgi:hypothetical protein